MKLEPLYEHDRYRCLNEGVAVGAGEVRTLSEGVTELVIEWKELVWEPPAEDP